jgi:P-type Cu2+ transporter
VIALQKFEAMEVLTKPEAKFKKGESTYIKETFPVLEMTCAACAVSVESMLKSVEGVKEVNVNFANQTALVAYDPSLASPEDLRRTVQAIGYDLVIETVNRDAVKEQAQIDHYRKVRQRTIWAWVITLPIVVIGMLHLSHTYANWVMMLLSIPVVFYFGRSFFINAWKQAKNRKANMDTLVALSTGIAFLFSAFNTIYPGFWEARGLQAHVYFEAAAAVVAFILLGKLLEEKAKSNTSSALRKLIGLQPKTVQVVTENDELKYIPVAEVKTGFTVQVKPGERIPVDGTVTSGESYVDESMITGESIPVLKKAGDKVFAGTMNQKGSFRFTTEKVGGDTILGQIIRMVQEAQGSKAPVQKLVDKVAGIFVPVVIGISVVTLVAWIVFGGENGFTYGLLNAITVLVIACPCALGLATPTAIMVGVGKAAENNILIKDAESLEIAHRVNSIVLDKTGTITEGRPSVTNLLFFKEENLEALKGILLAMELQSEHPLAEAVTTALQEAQISPATINQINSVTGKGIFSVYNNKHFIVGNLQLLSDHKVEISDEQSGVIQNLQQEAKTVIGFAEDQTLLAVIAIADQVKATSRQGIETLTKNGIEVHMLSGDNNHTTAAIAKQVGVTSFKGEVLPSEKSAFIKQLQQQGKIVAMVGDGINDSQALAQADVSIAMGRGSDIAMDVAKVTLITSDLQSIYKALNLSRRTIVTIRQNLFWAFIYNLIGIPLAAGLLFPINGFLLNPMIAGAAMALSSVSVVLNSIRLKFA